MNELMNEKEEKEWIGGEVIFAIFVVTVFFFFFLTLSTTVLFIEVKSHADERNLIPRIANPLNYCGNRSLYEQTRNVSQV